MEGGLAIPQMIKHSYHMTAILCLGISFPKERKVYVHTKPCKQMFMAALFIPAKGGNNPNVHQLIMNKIWLTIHWNIIQPQHGVKY